MVLGLLLKNIKTYDKAILSSICLGKEENKINIDNFANSDVNYDKAELCAEFGFKKLKEIIESAGDNDELLEKRLFKDLKELYDKNVEGK